MSKACFRRDLWHKPVQIGSWLAYRYYREAGDSQNCFVAARSNISTWGEVKLVVRRIILAGTLMGGTRLDNTRMSTSQAKGIVRGVRLITGIAWVSLFAFLMGLLCYVFKVPLSVFLVRLIGGVMVWGTFLACVMFMLARLFDYWPAKYRLAQCVISLGSDNVYVWEISDGGFWNLAMSP